MPPLTGCWGLYEKAIELEPTNPIYRYEYGYQLGKADRWDDSIAQLRLTVSQNPEFFPANHWLGTQLIEKFGSYDEAMIYLRKALVVDPFKPMKKIRSAFEDLGDIAEAKRWTEMLMALGPLNSDAHSGDLYRYQGETIRAFEAYGKALSQTEDSLGLETARLFMFNQQMRAGKFEEIRARYAAGAPYLFEEDIFSSEDPSLSYQARSLRARMAIELAAALMNTGGEDMAGRLMGRALSFHFDTDPIGYNKEYYRALTRLLAGDEQACLALLKDAVERGFRNRWMLEDARLDPLQGHPEYINLMESVESDMAEQLAAIRQMELGGEFAAIPQF